MARYAACLTPLLPHCGRRTAITVADGAIIRGLGYLYFSHAESARRPGRGDTRDVLDRLVSSDVLRRGFLLSCERCRWQAFYAVSKVGKIFTCAACSHASNMASGAWYKGDPEPAWNYSLDQVARTLLQQHGDIPMLAADRLRQGARDFLWAPELSIQVEPSPIEIDICAIVNGWVILGEAKCNGRLDFLRIDPLSKLPIKANPCRADTDRGSRSCWLPANPRGYQEPSPLSSQP